MAFPALASPGKARATPAGLSSVLPAVSTSPTGIPYSIEGSA